MVVGGQIIQQTAETEQKVDAGFVGQGRLLLAQGSEPAEQMGIAAELAEVTGQEAARDAAIAAHGIGAQSKARVWMQEPRADRAERVSSSLYSLEASGKVGSGGAGEEVAVGIVAGGKSTMRAATPASSRRCASCREACWPAWFSSWSKRMETERSGRFGKLSHLSGREMCADGASGIAKAGSKRCGKAAPMLRP